MQGAVAGSYLANPDLQTDINARVAILKNAVDTAKASLPTGETDVINVFVAPELYLHGTPGQYFTRPSTDPVKQLRQLLTETYDAADYPNWTFICGSVITTMLKNVDKIYADNSTTTRNSVVQNLSEQWLASFGR